MYLVTRQHLLGLLLPLYVLPGYQPSCETKKPAVKVEEGRGVCCCQPTAKRGGNEKVKPLTNCGGVQLYNLLPKYSVTILRRPSSELFRPFNSQNIEYWKKLLSLLVWEDISNRELATPSHCKWEVACLTVFCALINTEFWHFTRQKDVGSAEAVLAFYRTGAALKPDS